MYKIVGIVFFILECILIVFYGWIAIIWSSIGYLFGMYSTSNMVLPIIIGLPVAFRLVLKKRMRPIIFLVLFRAPIIWSIGLIILGFIIEWISPNAINWIVKNQTLNIGLSFGFIAILLTLLSKEGRDDFRADFDKFYDSYFICNYKSNEKWNEGYDAYEFGKDFLKYKQDEKALQCFDIAIENGFKDEIYSLRGISLQSLDYHYNAIEDFDKAILSSPNDCNLYYLRASSKHAILDSSGAIADIEKAIELSKEDNELNRNYNKGAIEMGYKNGSTEIYENYLNTLIFLEDTGIEKIYRDELPNASPEKKERIEKNIKEYRESKLKNIKRR